MTCQILKNVQKLFQNECSKMWNGFNLNHVRLSKYLWFLNHPFWYTSPLEIKLTGVPLKRFLYYTLC